jgi:hypothetical protein
MFRWFRTTRENQYFVAGKAAGKTRSHLRATSIMNAEKKNSRH